MHKDINNFIKRLNQDGFAIIHDGKLARELSKKPPIKKLRSTKTLYIGNDRKRNVTIFLKKPFL